IDLLDGPAESAADVQQPLSVGDLAGLQQHAVHRLHGRDVVGSRTRGSRGVFPVAPVHLALPQLPGLTAVLPFVDQQVEIWELRHARNVPLSKLDPRMASRSVAVPKSMVRGWA